MKTSATVQKVWSGGKNRPDVEVQLFRQVPGGNKEFVGEAVKLNATSNWTHTWNDLDKTNANGQDYIYTVDEIEVPAGYSKTIETVEGATNSFKITNTFGVTTGDITAYKKWVGGDSLERPTDIYFQLVKDGVNEGDAKALGSATEITWDDMPLVKADGTPIAYTVKEVKEDGSDWEHDNYDVTYDGLVVTNTYKSETRSVFAKKIWSGGAQDDHVVPAFSLYRNGTLVEGVTPKVTQNADKTEYSFEWSGLATNDAYGQAYYYTVVEAGTYENYGKSAVTGDGKTATTAYTITNTYNAPTTTHSFTKTWVDGPAVKPVIEVQLLQNGVAYRQKVALANGTTSHEWTGLPTTDAEGNAYVYTVQELTVGGIEVVNGVAGDYAVTEENTGTASTITNTYNAPTVTLTGQKTWIRDGESIRPDSLTVELLRNGSALDPAVTTTTNAAADWKYEFANVAQTDTEGNAYTYTVRETDVPNGYEAGYDGMNITNTFVGTASVDITKVWVDDSNAGDTRPDQITLIAIRSDGQRYEKVFDVDKLNDTAVYTFAVLPQFDSNGNEYTYTVDEVSVAGYVKKIEGTTITNMLEDTMQIDVTKNWVGGPATKPTITVNLLANDVVVSSIELENGNVSHTFENLPKYDGNGALIAYTVTEDDVDGFTTAIGGDSTRGFVITNTYKIAKTTATVEKVWSGGIERPEVKVQLFRQVTSGNKEFVGDAIVLNEDNEWKHTWSNLDTTDANGNGYVYTVDELNVPDGYDKAITGTGTDADPFVITNTFGITTGDITAYKKWVGGDSLERPTDIYFQLVKDGVNEGDAKALGSATEVTWENMPLVNTNGTPIVYTVKEVKEDGSDWKHDNYDVSYKGLVVTNTYKSETRSVFAKKIWSGGAQDDHVVPAFSLYRNGTLVEGVTPKVTQNADKTEYSFEWSGLAANDAYGQAYYYTVVEAGTYENYGKSAVTGDGKTEGTAYTITNTYKAPTTTHSFTKTWVDGPTVKPTIEVQLLQNDTAYGTKVALANGTTSHEWTGLPTTDAEGNAYVYTVQELTVGGLEVINGVAGDYAVTEENTGTASTITNTYNAPTVTLTGQKTWIRDGESIRPDSLTVELLRNGSALDPAVTTTTNAAADWKYEFANVAQTDTEGNAYTYTVRETEVPNGYEAGYDGMNITNTFVGTASVDITKVWVDDSNAGKTRPDQITLIAIRNDGQRYDKVFDVVENEDEATYTIADLPKFDGGGNEYTYTVDEVSVAGYTKIIEGHTITNKLSGTIDIPYEKRWVGAPATHPSIRVILSANGTEVDSVTIDDGDSLEGVFEDKPVYDADGKKITYTVAEEIQENSALYNTKSELINGKWIITNTYSGKVSIPVLKLWQYADGTTMPDDNIPSSITKVFVVLYRNNESMAVKELTRDNGWQATFEELKKFDENGDLYTYRVEELPVDGFTSSQSTDSDGAVTIVNKKHDTPTMSIPVQKLWDGEKPTDIENITVVLTRTVDGEADAFKQTLVIRGPEWNGEFTGLEREDANGNKYVYEVTEEPVPGYEPVYTGGGACGFVIHNEPTTAGQLTFTKVAAGTNDGLAGAEFELRGITKPSYSQKAVSDADGNVRFTNVPYGEYVLSETKAPAGYEAQTKTWTVVVDRDGNVTIDGASANDFTVENDIVKGVVELTKTFEGKVPQAGQQATFALYKVVGEMDTDDNGETDDTKIGDYTTDTAGKIRVTNLDRGDYYFVETAAPNGYATDATPIEFTVAGTVDETIELTMDNVRETTAIHVEKQWEGGSDRPDVKVQLYRQAGSGHQEIVGNAVVLNEANEWKHTWQAMERTNASGEEYTYTVDEVAVPQGYDKRIAGTGTETDPFVITNTFGATQADVTVTKTWIGGPVTKPDIELQLLRNIEGQTPQPVNGIANAILTGGELTHTWPNLDTTDENGAPYTYSVKEVVVPDGYAAEYDGLKVTNRFTALVGLPIQKTDEAGNPLGGAKFGLFDRTGTTLLQEQISLFDGKLRFDGLEPGEQYVLRETQAPEGYVLSNERYQVHVSLAGVVEVIGNSGVIDSNPLILTNNAYVEPEPETVRVVVHKTWANLEPGDKPENHVATFTLQPTGAVKTIRGNGTAVFENLPKYDADHNRIDYTVTETPLNGFETIAAGNQDDGFVFTNYPTRKFGVVLQKIDDRSQAVLPGAEFELWGKLKEGATTLSATLVLGEDVALTEPISVQLFKDGNDTGQSVQLDATHPNDEFTVDGGGGRYSVVVPPVNGLDIRVEAHRTGFVIRADKAAKTDGAQTETLAEELQEQKDALERLAQQGDSAEAKAAAQGIAERKAEIEDLTRATDPAVTTELRSKQGDLRNERDAVNEELATAGEDEQESLLAKKAALETEIDEIEAALDDIARKETEIARLQAEIATLQEEADNAASREEAERAQERADRTERIRELEALWTEAEEAEAEGTVRQDATVELTGNGAKNANGYVLIGKYVTDEHGLIAVGDLEEGEYYFIETKAPEGYTGDLSQEHKFSVPDPETSSKPVTITVENTLTTPETVEYTVMKVWKGGPAVKPDIRIQLLQDGQNYGAPITLKDGESVYTWTNLPKYNGKNLVVYTVEEVDAPNGYDVSVAGNVITNTWNNSVEPDPTDEYTTISGKKTWLNDTEADRPTSITVKLVNTATGKTEQTKTVTSENGWAYAFENVLIRDKHGNSYSYRVEEVVPEGYEASYHGYDITNTKKTTEPDPDPEDQYGTIFGQKTWKGDTEADRPTSITVKLVNTATGKTEQTKTVTSESGWTYAFENVLLQDKEGNTYSYRVEEVVPAGYVVAYQGYNITNTKKTTEPDPDPEEQYGTISGKKTWVGDTESDRPTSITVKLVNTATGKTVQTKTVTAKDSWTYAFENVLIRDKNGISYSYRVEEVVPAGYVVAYQGYNITNTKKTVEPDPDPENQFGTISGQKTWKGDTAADRPTSITVKLIDTATGKTVQTKTVTAADGWAYAFENVLIRDKNGISYSYRVEEVVPAGYEVTYQGYNITNTKKTTEPDPDPEDQFGTISGQKTWKGDTEADRPASITVKLVNAATGEVVATKTVTAADGWTYAFENVLIRDADGNGYTYRVEEVVPTGYTVSVQGYDLTNTKTSEDTPTPEPPTPPKPTPVDPKPTPTDPKPTPVDPKPGKPTPEKPSPFRPGTGSKASGGAKGSNAKAATPNPSTGVAGVGSNWIAMLSAGLLLIVAERKRRNWK